MDTTALKNFAQVARRQLLAQVGARMEQVLTTDTAALREKQAIINQLKVEVKQKGKQAIIEEVAYTWFNRLCALRYMDVNHYTQVGIVSPTAGFTQPEILQQAKQGLIEPGWQLDRKRVSGLLNRSISSPDGDQEAYRLLLVAACNSYAREMDFLFTAIEDVTELLMPEDLLSNQSVLQAVRDTLTPEVCQDVEVIGWLYQFYISEKKDQVMAGKGAVKKEDIPSVTQLFTPDWIVRYMVQNSLGRLWLLNYPDSKIREQMEYYVQPADPETDFLRVSSPEDLKVLDPACGSGHILTYAFDLLYAIYEEQGYDPLRIPQYILQKNLYGIEIDKRAAMLSSFALMMKARAKDKRFFSRGIKPNILEMEDVSFEPAEIKAYLDKLGHDLYTQDLWEGMRQFENATTFGSLIRPVIKDVPTLRERIRETRIFEDLLLSNTNDKLLKVLEMSEYLGSRYQVVVANPPYFSRGFDSGYREFADNHYPDSKADTFSMFIERNLELTRKVGYVGMITLISWMFLSSFEKLRRKLISEGTILSMAHLGPRAFDTIGGDVVSTTMFILTNIPRDHYSGDYFRLVEGSSENQKIFSFNNAISNCESNLRYKVKARQFQKLPGAQISYWINENIADVFVNDTLNEYATLFQGIITGNNDKFVRYWHEVNLKNIMFNSDFIDDVNLQKTYWLPYNKGGAYRKWYGNQEYIVNFSHQGRDFTRGKHQFSEFFFKPCFSWSYIGTSSIAARYFPVGFLWDVHGSSVFPKVNDDLFFFLSLVGSTVGYYLLNAINSTVSFQVENLAVFPVIYPPSEIKEKVSKNSIQLVENSKFDWDDFETSWEFSVLPVLKVNDCSLSNTVSASYHTLHYKRQELIEQSIFLETENNKLIIGSYGLQAELTPEVPLADITLTCNPYYRYKGNLTDEEREARLLQDTMKEFLSYAVGCMFGRYSLDKPGLILANQGETLQDYLQIIGKDPLFSPTETNVLPILEGEWFADDIVARFKQFLKVTFGEPNYEENLRFIENALGKDLRRYFLKDFYKDHVQTYQKRPIYWLFSSPKGSFNALIYMHRYQPNTVSVVLNQYLREYREKLNAQRRYQESLSISPSSSQREKTAALKEIESLSKILSELKTYEDEVLFPLAGEQIEIDLDDGVVVNYAKFGDALRRI